ncbi:Acyl-CoA Delta(11) desaturase [Araneus ventricosus]|uniref:Acyl-CoA Delta(11) desaturase n=1 Tax=Araneus ventricosus TaxID=182803 RepID=A0A4Y2KH55_ARAVE|nr:Acyl-CoA Delta(11) desaturase [Araneus ventricosus]GBN03713.1 Acyl-CoA Delta(11) desaturase [Araneus ventricosus]
METNSKIVEEPVHCYRSEKQEYRTKLFWRNVIWYAFLHLAALYGFYLMFTSATWKTSLFAFTLGHVSLLGITAGAHRLWSHRSYKARWPLRVFLCILNTVAFQVNYFQCRSLNNRQLEFVPLNIILHLVPNQHYTSVFGFFLENLFSIFIGYLCSCCLSLPHDLAANFAKTNGEGAISEKYEAEKFVSEWKDYV